MKKYFEIKCPDDVDEIYSKVLNWINNLTLPRSIEEEYLEFRRKCAFENL